MKKNRMYAVLAAMVMLCSLAGCGAQKNETATEDVINHDAPVAKAKDRPDAGDDGIAALAGNIEDAAPERAYREDAYLKGDVAEAEAFAADTPRTALEYEGDIIGDDIAPVAPDPEPVPAAEAGVLTAGEWKDHDNWGFFANLVNNGTISFPSFGIDPTQRIAVTVSSGDGTPLPNAKVQLMDADGNVIWNAVSDKNGKAYLFETDGKKGAKVTAVNKEGTSGETAIDAAGGGDTQSKQLVTDRQATVTIDAAAVTVSDVQVMFIVDTTGSMGDEMLYLQSDFAAIAEDAGTDQTTYAVSFYRDEGDAYVTKLGSDFTADVSQIRSALNAESADGGGDEPEAVAEALTEAFSMDGWNDDSVKIAFLIYDAPPHTGKEEMLTAAIEDAAAKGIRIVPVVSSNGSRETELFGRAAAICTGGSYVFLTDDSGVGGSHLEPIIGDYEVEKLHDIIVRIITDARQ